MFKIKNKNFFLKALSTKPQAIHPPKIFEEKFRRASGFSLVELIMVIAIFLIITTITLGNQAKFSSNILITNLAYQLALSIREAQVYGIGSRQATDTSGSTFRLGYGININAQNSKANTYTVFADTRPEEGFNFYFEPGIDIEVENILLTQGQKIRNFCGLSLSDPDDWSCWQNGGFTPFELNIVFIKPDPDAHVWGRFGGEGEYTEYSEAEILLESALGDKCRTVRVSGAGQISVDPVSSDPDTCRSGLGSITTK